MTSIWTAVVFLFRNYKHNIESGEVSNLITELSLFVLRAGPLAVVCHTQIPSLFIVFMGPSYRQTLLSEDSVNMFYGRKTETSESGESRRSQVSVFLNFNEENAHFFSEH